MDNLKTGDKIKFLRPDGVVVDDVVSGITTTTICLMPYAPNKEVDCILLTNHSWCQPSDIVEVRNV